MLKDIPKLVMISTVAVFLMVTFAYFAINGYKQDSTVQAMSETLRSVALANRDDSARIERGQFKLQVEEFESDFKESFELNQNLTTKDEDYEYIFDYLEDGQGGIKAIKVKVFMGETEYQATCMVNVAEE